MPLTEGARIGPYQILYPLGAGGMGEVHRARDLTLNRDVALKVLPDSLAGEPDRLARLRREAQVVASLNHPNIAHVHGFHDADGVHALVMELVEGPTLADRIASGPIPINEALPIARQIADALEAAHEQGVVHRDLKPANIKVRHDGMVKVLDFGIAKAFDLPLDTPRDGLSTPELISTLTIPGAILGTAAYMSPEQAKGRGVDRRTDIWAFGVVIYEMLTGERLFGGDNTSETLAFVLMQEIDWTKLPVATPAALRRLLERCLDRDVRTRLRDMGEARIEIWRMIAVPSGTATGGSTGAPVRVAHAAPAWAAWLTAVASIAALGIALAAWSPWRTPSPALPIRFAIPSTAAMPLTLRSLDVTLAISPDGTHVAYTSSTSEPNLIIRAIDQVDATPVPGVIGAHEPFFSPDGKWVGFITGAQDIMKVPLSGGPPVTLCNFPVSRGFSWGPNGTIFVGSMAIGAGLFAVPENGGEPKRLSAPDLSKGEVGHLFPFALPGGDALLFTITDEDVAKNQIAVLDLKTGAIKKLFRGGSGAKYVEPGVLVYAASGTLRAIRFDLTHLSTIGDSQPLTEAVTMESTGASQYDVAQNGTLVYMPGSQTTRDVPRSLMWVDRQGREEAIPAPVRAYTAVKLSPDGAHLALDLRDQAQDVWTWDFARRQLERFTVGPGLNAFPIWSTDGKRIIFGGLQGGLVQNLFSQPFGSAGTPTRLTTSSGSQSPTTISPDGRHVLFREVTAATGEDVVMLTLPEGTVTPLLHTPYTERNAAISPDGRFVAFEWSESGRPQVYVSPFPDVASGRWQVTDASTGNGTKPVWAPDGHELFFAGRGALYSVPVETKPTFTSGKPTRLFDVRDFVVNGGRYYDVSRDGRRFVVIKDLTPASNDAANQPRLVVTVNWVGDAKAKLGIR